MTKYHTSTTTKILWLTDLHHDRADGDKRRKIYHELQSKDYGVAVITGDIASADCLLDHLESLAAACSPRLLCVVTGNHDCYGSSIAETTRQVSNLARKIKNLHHLHGNGAIPLGGKTILVGHHGWADGKAGWGARTFVPNPDHWSIDEFRKLSRDDRFKKMEQLGQESAKAIRHDLFPKIRYTKHIVIATHVPAFRTSVMFNESPCGPCHQPHFTNMSLGGMLIATARRNPAVKFTVLSGHTHTATNEMILNNLASHVGEPSNSAIMHV
jgi:hypothetical protein